MQHAPKIGMRVKIYGVLEDQGGAYPSGNSQREHVGKMGTIIRWHQVRESMRSLIIRLDDGNEINGWEYALLPVGLLPRCIDFVPPAREERRS